MTLEEKKDTVRAFVRTGMDVTSAMIASDCTDAEQTLLSDDDKFQRSIQVAKVLMERDCLDKLHRAINVADTGGKGDTTTLRWYMERTNREKWGNGSSQTSPVDGLKRIVFEYDAATKKEFESNDNVEVGEVDRGE